MHGSESDFAGSVPAIYDRYMVPLIFRPYAKLAAERVRDLQPRRILETAAGTGVLTEELIAALPEARIFATDLNQPMLDEAVRRLPSSAIVFQQADALALPFEAGSFDFVICQFGAMFFPDKVRANAEARRVLRDGGSYMMLIWNSIDRNLATKVAGRAVANLFPEGRTDFYERVPFSYFQTRKIESDLVAAGFLDIAVETVELPSKAKSARDAAIALIQGTPMRLEIEAGGEGMLITSTKEAELALRQFETVEGFEAPMSAHLVLATK